MAQPSDHAAPAFDVALDQPLQEKLVSDFLAKLWYVAEDLQSFELSPDRGRVHFRLNQQDAARAAVVAARIADTARTMSTGFRPAEQRVLLDRSARTTTYSDDPHPILEARGELFRYGSGRYGLGPLLTNLVDVFREHFHEAARELGASPRQFPTLIGADAMARCKYFQTFPHSLTFVSHLREDLDAIKEFSRDAKWDGSRLTMDRDALAAVQCILASSVCFHHYAWLADTRLEKPHTVTALAKCFRFESGNLSGLERLWDFTMQEIIFVGDREFVARERQLGMDRICALVDSWGLSYQVRTATDPFFIDGYATQASFQSVFELKSEIRAHLPYKGNDASLAVGSFNYHQDFLGRAFDIEIGDAKAHTGCIGIGLERLALAFVAQYGPDTANWPDSIARRIHR